MVWLAEVPTLTPGVVYSGPTVRGGAGQNVVKSLRKVVRNRILLDVRSKMGLAASSVTVHALTVSFGQIS